MSAEQCPAFCPQHAPFISGTQQERRPPGPGACTAAEGQLCEARRCDPRPGVGSRGDLRGAGSHVG